LARLIIATGLDRVIRHRPWLLKLMFRLESGVMHLVWWTFASLSPERAARVGAAMMRWAGPRTRKQAWVNGNLAIAFPERSEAELRSLARATWSNIGSVGGEFPHLERIALDGGGKRLELVDPCGLLPKYAARERSAVFFSGHLSNWEINALALVRAGVPLISLYAGLQNEHLDALMGKARAQLGCTMVSRDGSMRPVIKHLSEGGSLGVLADLRVKAGGMPIPFFGRDMTTSLVPARLALRHGCDLVPIRVERLRPSWFRVTVHEPLDVPALGSDDEQAVTLATAMSARIEEWIRERPGEWLCTNRRWPKSLYPHKQIAIDEEGQ
jgi:KDO2-lipid IV(A) lauroyltransferase